MSGMISDEGLVGVGRNGAGVRLGAGVDRNVDNARRKLS